MKFGTELFFPESTAEYYEYNEDTMDVTTNVMSEKCRFFIL